VVRDAMATIAVQVATGTVLDPDLVADHYWDLQHQPMSAGPIEHVYRG